MPKEYYTTSEAAEMLGTNRVQVFRMIKSGKIKARKIGRNYAIPASELSPTETDKRDIEQVVDRVIEEYGETLKKLGEE